MLQEIQTRRLGKAATAFGSLALASAAIVSACGGSNGETKSVRTEPTLPLQPSPTREIPTPTPEITPTPDPRIVGMEPIVYTGQLAKGLGTVRIAVSPPKPDTSGQPPPPPIVGYPLFYDPGPLRITGFEIELIQPVLCNWKTKDPDGKEYPDKTYNFIGSPGNVFSRTWGIELASDGSFSYAAGVGNDVVAVHLQGRINGNSITGRYWQVHNYNVGRYCGDFSFQAAIQ